jgi:hypothetical protein
MSESWFDDVDVDDIPDNPNELPNSTYKFKVTSAKFAPTQAGDKRGITFKYQIVEGSWSNFFPLVDWVRVPDKGMAKDEKERMLSYLKMRLLGFGFAPEDIQSFGPGMVMETLNREFYGTTSAKKDKDNRTNIKVVKFDPIEDGAGIADHGIDTSDDSVPDF